MPPKSTRIDQNLVDEPIEKLLALVVHESELTEEHLDKFLSSSGNNLALGFSPGFNKAGHLNALAIANTTRILLVQFYSNNQKKDRTGAVIAEPARSSPARKWIEEKILCRPIGNNLAFDFAPLALALYQDCEGMHITNGIDIQSACDETRDPLSAIQKAAGDARSEFLYKDNIKMLFGSLVYNDENTNNTSILLQAWISQYLTQYDGMEDIFAQAKKIDTTQIPPSTFQRLAMMSFNARHLEGLKPQATKHSVASSSYNQLENTVDVKGQRFQDRISSRTVDKDIKVRVRGSAGDFTQTVNVAVKPWEAIGKTASLASQHHLQGKEILQVISTGKDSASAADARKEQLILQVLQGNTELLTENSWIHNVSQDTGEITWPPEWETSQPTVVSPPSINPVRLVNPSQLSTIETMLSSASKDYITIIQGPPGTGKTTVIATFVETATATGQTGIWLVAQSNVAVKNIAEKLAAFGLQNWRILVSRDFHHEWHEHLYHKISSKVIRSDEFSKPFFKARKSLQGCQILLCTLSMMSNPKLQPSGITRVIPVNTLVVDEASQIEIGNYLPVFERFGSTLRKACFIGDNKQLPPYGEDDVHTLYSVFELEKLSSLTLFLDTQYRMPPQIGDFISEAVYDNKLKSNPLHPITDTTIACHFIDVPGSREQAIGTSWKNEIESQALMELAQQFQEDGKVYRIITPYDPQRDLLERSLKASNLEWEDKCFNVDSFQGNEEDFIIISLVRSRKLGFLEDLRRTNVMLSRCKKGMFIFTSRSFLALPDVAESLVGKLEKHVGEKGWLSPEALRLRSY